MKVAPNFVFGETNKSEAFLKKFPAGKVSVTFMHFYNIFSDFSVDFSE